MGMIVCQQQRNYWLQAKPNNFQVGRDVFPSGQHGLDSDWFTHACPKGVSFPPVEGAILATLAKKHLAREEWSEACQILKAGMAIDAVGIHAFSKSMPMLALVGRKGALRPSLPTKDICELCILWARSQR